MGQDKIVGAEMRLLDGEAWVKWWHDALLKGKPEVPDAAVADAELHGSDHDGEGGGDLEQGEQEAA
eukprot:5663807-Pyramimonas_sp.AAC.1